jgi:hypothetical protein
VSERSAVIVARAIVYGSLAVFITSVYLAIAVGLGALVGSSGHQNLGLSIVATVIVAVGFQPVRERLRKLANRLVYHVDVVGHAQQGALPDGR